jgi:thiol-disulfide isomerase/thioredoxin
MCAADRLESLVLGVLLVAVGSINGHGTLFSFNGDVIQLWANNFTSVVHSSPRVWVVDYYLAWCGYCQRLAPDFAKFATDIKSESDLCLPFFVDVS